jgi:glycosyltransferase involved in cell wall biosynthesis
MVKYKVFVFARLKPSQIDYKILPLSCSAQVERVYILRKTPLLVKSEKVECIALPWILRPRLLYWIFTSIYGAWLIKKKGANLIIAYNIFPHGFNGYLASILTKKPLLFAEINEDTLEYYNSVLAKTIIRKILNKAKYIIVPGSNFETRWRKNGYNKFVRLHSTIDTDVFFANGKGKSIDFIFIGEFDKNKRPELILNAFCVIRGMGFDVSMCMIGFGILDKMLAEEIKNRNLGSKVSIIKTSNVLEYVSSSKIFLMASISEGIPCAMLEAMACELIVIVPPVGDITDVVKHDINGFLHDNSLEDIVNKMLYAYTNYDRLNNLRIKARETIVFENSYNVATEKWNDLLPKLELK